MTIVGYTEFWANLTPLQRIDEKIRVAKYQIAPDANRLAWLHAERASLLGQYPDAPATCVVDARLSSGAPYAGGRSEGERTMTREELVEAVRTRLAAYECGTLGCVPYALDVGTALDAYDAERARAVWAEAERDAARTEVEQLKRVVATLRGADCAIAQGVDGRGGCGLCPACAHNARARAETWELRARQAGWGVGFTQGGSNG